MAAQTMQSWQYSPFSGKLEDALELVEHRPVPSAASLTKDQLLIQVISAALNPVDYKLPESGVIGRIMLPNPASPGLDFCGRIVAKHPSVVRFREGQVVFGALGSHSSTGTLSQYTVVSSKNCAVLPEGTDPDDGAAVGIAATTAYQSLTPATLPADATVFINGGTGGVGTWAVQIAKALGAKVVTTCSTKNLDLCRGLGPDELIDYAREEVLSILRAKGPVFDLVIDNVGNSEDLYRSRLQFLKPGGTFVQVGVGEGVSLASVGSTLVKSLWPSSGRKFYFVNMKNDAEYFERIGGWMAEGKAKPNIAARFPFEDVPAAFTRLREGRAPGKIVINIVKEHGQSE